MLKKKLLSTLITTGSYTSFIDEIVSLSQRKESSYVCVSNVHMLIEAYRDTKFNAIVSNADVATPDGMPLALSMRLLYGIKQDRVAGMDLLPSLFAESAAKSLSIYFYGATDETLALIQSKVKHEYPTLTIAGMYSPPFRTLTEEEKQEIVVRINAANPDFVMVALGCPKQERWMADHKDKIKSCMLGVGGAFGVYAGIQKRAPEWMQRYSLEWVYRFVQEPKRLWKRYLVTNTLFCLLMAKCMAKHFLQIGYSNSKKLTLWTGQAQGK